MGIKIEVEITDAIIDRIADRVIQKTESKPSETKLTVSQVCERLGKSERTVYRYIKKELLKTTKEGKEHIITETNLKNFINGTN